MTQQYNRRSTRRTTRAGRNRPELVTSTNEPQETPADLATSQPVEEEVVTSPTTPISPHKRKLASFFSTVGRGEKSQEAQEAEAAQARLARATRGKITNGTKEEQKAAEPGNVSSPARKGPPPPASPFKFKYLLGFAIYLFGAQYIGALELELLTANHLNTVYTTLSIFGGKVQISTHTIVFLATLLALLVVLARLDLMPRSLSAMAGQPQQQARRNTTNASNSNSGTPKPPQPTIRRGVSGADDDLYQEYRLNQRRARKR